MLRTCVEDEEEFRKKQARCKWLHVPLLVTKTRSNRENFFGKVGSFAAPILVVVFYQNGSLIFFKKKLKETVGDFIFGGRFWLPDLVVGSSSFFMFLSFCSLNQHLPPANTAEISASSFEWKGVTPGPPNEPASIVFGRDSLVLTTEHAILAEFPYPTADTTDPLTSARYTLLPAAGSHRRSQPLSRSLARGLWRPHHPQFFSGALYCPCRPSGHPPLPR